MIQLSFLRQNYMFKSTGVLVFGIKYGLWEIENIIYDYITPYKFLFMSEDIN